MRPALWIAVIGACGAPRTVDPAPASSTPVTVTAPSPASWRDAYDLDGDGINDRIVAESTGGAHCCYRIGVVLSSTGRSTMLPFEMDGGYPRGLDLSQPDHFTVRRRANGLPEIVYQIGTYNGEPQPLDPEASRQWGISSRHIALCFAGGTAKARDEAPDLPRCRR